MTEQEKYLEGHCNCGIKVGDRVLATRKAEDWENGWCNRWNSSMDKWVGKQLTIIGDYEVSGFKACSGTGESWDFGYPYFVLEKI